jgi:hypothetical protein
MWQHPYQSLNLIASGSAKLAVVDGLCGSLSLLSAEILGCGEDAVEVEVRQSEKFGARECDRSSELQHSHGSLWYFQLAGHPCARSLP